MLCGETPTGALGEYIRLDKLRVPQFRFQLWTILKRSGRHKYQFELVVIARVDFLGLGNNYWTEPWSRLKSAQIDIYRFFGISELTFGILKLTALEKSLFDTRDQQVDFAPRIPTSELFTERQVFHIGAFFSEKKKQPRTTSPPISTHLAI